MKSKSTSKARHAKFLRSLGVPERRAKRPLSVWPVDTYVPRLVAPTSDTIPANGHKSSLDDYKWKRGVTENPREIYKAEQKRKKIAPYTNKGGYMYITEETDPKSIGKKV